MVVKGEPSTITSYVTFPKLVNLHFKNVSGISVLCHSHLKNIMAVMSKNISLISCLLSIDLLVLMSGFSTVVHLSSLPNPHYPYCFCPLFILIG